MESGSPTSFPLFNASRRALLWDAFAANTTQCAGVPRGSTFPCLRNSTTSELLASWESALAVFPDLLLFMPVIDGPDGLLPDSPLDAIAAGKFSKIPFIAGTVLDEGTLFVPQDISVPEELLDVFLGVDSPYPQQLSNQYVQDIETLFELYSGDPALGSPFGTGNETFGLDPLYKLASAVFGDMTFQAPRRLWIQAAAEAGVPTYGYIFADQNAAKAEPSLGGTNTWSDIMFAIVADVVGLLPSAPWCRGPVCVRILVHRGREHDERSCIPGHDRLLGVVRGEWHAQRWEGPFQYVFYSFVPELVFANGGPFHQKLLGRSTNLTTRYV